MKLQMIKFQCGKVSVPVRTHKKFGLCARLKGWGWYKVENGAAIYAVGMRFPKK